MSVDALDETDIASPATGPSRARASQGGGTHATVTLRFADAELEAEYRLKMAPRVRRQLRASLISSVPVWLTAGAVLYQVLDQATSVLVAAGSMVALLAFLLVLEPRARGVTALYAIGAVSNTIPGLTALGVIWREGLFDVAGPISILAAAAYSFTMLNLPFVVSVVAVSPYVVACLALIAASDSMMIAPLHATVLILVSLVLATGAYMREAAQRRDFRLTRVIAEQERELDDAHARQMGQYTLLSKVGQGGMGVVYRARHALLRRPTAVKLLTTRDATPTELAMFEREVQLTSELSHPNVVSIYDYGRGPEGEFYYAMEYLPGLDLQRLVAREGPLPPGRAVAILMQVLAGVGDAHFRGLVHRDIKPGNVIVSRFGPRADVVRVVDFGLVRELRGDSRLPTDHAVAGTPAYMAPEAIIDPQHAGHTADLYAVGSLAMFLLTGQPPFVGASVDELLEQQVSGTPHAPSGLSPFHVPPALDAWVLRLLEKRPQDRFSSAESACEALATVSITPWLDGSTWWDEYEASRGATDPGAISETAFSLTVELRGREDSSASGADAQVV